MGGWITVCGSAPPLFVWFPLLKYKVYNTLHMPLVASKGMYFLVFVFFPPQEHVDSIFDPVCIVHVFAVFGKGV